MRPSASRPHAGRRFCCLRQSRRLRPHCRVPAALRAPTRRLGTYTSRGRACPPHPRALPCRLPPDSALPPPPVTWPPSTHSAPPAPPACSEPSLMTCGPSATAAAAPPVGPSPLAVACPPCASSGYTRGPSSRRAPLPRHTARALFAVLVFNGCPTPWCPPRPPPPVSSLRRASASPLPLARPDPPAPRAVSLPALPLSALPLLPLGVVPVAQSLPLVSRATPTREPTLLGRRPHPFALPCVPQPSFYLPLGSLPLSHFPSTSLIALPSLFVVAAHFTTLILSLPHRTSSAALVQLCCSQSLWWHRKTRPLMPFGVVTSPRVLHSLVLVFLGPLAPRPSFFAHPCPRSLKLRLPSSLAPFCPSPSGTRRSFPPLLAQFAPTARSPCSFVLLLFTSATLPPPLFCAHLWPPLRHSSPLFPLLTRAPSPSCFSATATVASPRGLRPRSGPMQPRLFPALPPCNHIVVRTTL